MDPPTPQPREARVVSDNELAAAAAAGRRLARALGVPSADLDDVVQEALYGAWRRYDPARGVSFLRYFLISLRFVALDRRRVYARLAARSVPYAQLDDISDIAAGSDTFATTDTADLIERLGDRLTMSDLKLLTVLLEGESLRQYAAAEGITMAAASRRARRLEALVRKYLAENL